MKLVRKVSERLFGAHRLAVVVNVLEFRLGFVSLLFFKLGCRTVESIPPRILVVFGRVALNRLSLVEGPFFNLLLSCSPLKCVGGSVALFLVKGRYRHSPVRRQSSFSAFTFKIERRHGLILSVRRLQKKLLSLFHSHQQRFSLS